MATGIYKRTIYDVDYAKNRSYKNKNIKCLIGNTALEIAETLKCLFYEEIKLMIESGINPSVDRIDSFGNYEVGNLRIIPLEENVSLGSAVGTDVTRKPVTVMFPNGDIKNYSSISECARELSMRRGTIITHRDNRTKTRKGLSFR